MKYLSHADLGGRTLPGHIENEPEGEPFHAAWEGRVLALTLAMGATGEWNIDMSRAARETLPDYAALSYYQVWLAALEKLLLQRGLVQAGELSQGQMLHPPMPLARKLLAAGVATVLAKGSPTERAALAPARFGAGQQVRARPGRVDHHTRLPAYVAGKTGIVERRLGCHVFADAHAKGQGEQPEWLYTVVFDGAELWGKDSKSTGLKVSVDAWEPYLEPA